MIENNRGEEERTVIANVVILILVIGYCGFVVYSRFIKKGGKGGGCCGCEGCSGCGNGSCSGYQQSILGEKSSPGK